MAFEKACSLEAPTTVAEVNELIDFTFTELNRRVGRAGFSPGQRVFGRQLRLPSSLLEDDLVLVAGEPVFIHRRKDGAQGWFGLGVCVLSEEPKPGRNETVWVHMRNRLHKCNRTQVTPATNEEAEGIETVTSLLPNLTEAVREGRTRHFADITAKEDPEDDEPMVVEGDVKDVRLGRPDSQQERELNAPANSNASSRSARSETQAEPAAEASTSAGTDMETGVGDRRVRFREERDSPRHHPGHILGPRVDGGTVVGKYQYELRQVNSLFLFIPPKQPRPSSNR